MAVALFAPRHVKEARLMAAHARKELHKRRDVLSDATIADVEAEIAKLEAAAKNGNERAITEASGHLDKAFGKVQPKRDDAGWRENCEVLLVAFVLAIGIRAYFLQPFKIPTGSMEPTLNGIISTPLPVKEPLPNIFRRVGEYFWLGRTYADAVSEVDDEITALKPTKRLGLLNYTRIECRSGRSYDVYVPAEKMTDREPSRNFNLYAGRKLKAGETIVHGRVDTGDQVFVDKFTYNFRLPRREDVFVFSTAGIEGTRRADMDPNVRSEYYIKRLAGQPGDTLRIDHPRLFINGALARGPYFERVMRAENGYHGYTNPRPIQMRYLTAPTETFTVPRENYFALGDNSANSSDSRAWGTVPARNVVGRGLFVYYPFTRHWGTIH